MSAAIQLIEEPHEFKQQLLNGIKTAKDRIYLASLYIGHSETDLLQTLDQQLKTTSVQVTILMDYFRGTRNDGGSSLQLVEQLKQKYPKRVKILLYQTPMASELYKNHVPKRFNEGLGLQHIKAYGFDNRLIISGANLSKDYFTNRQDRYLLIENEEISNYFAELIDLIGKYSWQLQNHLNPPKGIESFQRKAFRLSGYEEFTNFIEKWQSPIQIDKDVQVQPQIQLPPFFIHQDQERTLELLKSGLASDAVLHIASGYFNLPEIYQQLLFRSQNQIKILCGSPESNGFYGSKGISKYIPHAYTYLERQFLKQSRDNIQVYEYKRPGWTWHSKGIWIVSPNQLQTMIGSSNMNYRSLTRDLEAQLLIRSTNKTLNMRLEKHLESLYSQSVKVNLETLNHASRKTPLWVQFATRAIKRML
ncbi:hypothetical protein EDD86DRAFT_206132 [Gorgonomyces haynaldii]|nr:hypothetical protein EDD86DRAFT_206132 [Gorgonomyces haynaldii]